MHIGAAKRKKIITIWGNWNVNNILVTPNPPGASEPMIDVLEKMNERNQDQMMYQTTITYI